VMAEYGVSVLENLNLSSTFILESCELCFCGTASVTFPVLPLNQLSWHRISAVDWYRVRVGHACEQECLKVDDVIVLCPRFCVRLCGGTPNFVSVSDLGGPRGKERILVVTRLYCIVESEGLWRENHQCR
jgi:hypothetical protein